MKQTDQNSRKTAEQKGQQGSVPVRTPIPRRDAAEGEGRSLQELTSLAELALLVKWVDGWGESEISVAACERLVKAGVRVSNSDDATREVLYYMAEHVGPKELEEALAVAHGIDDLKARERAMGILQQAAYDGGDVLADCSLIRSELERTPRAGWRKLLAKIDRLGPQEFAASALVRGKR